MLRPGVLVVDDPERVGLVAAELVADRLRARPGLRVLLPTGRTPEGMYAALRAHASAGALPAAGATVFQLDEYLGLGAGDPESFRATLDRELAGIGFGRRESLDGAAADPDAEASRYQALLDAGRIDLAVLGIGRDAHVAFNEPGAGAAEGVHRVALTPSTIAANGPAFGGPERVPREALTVGLSTLRSAHEVLVLATGAGKAEAVRAMLEALPAPEAPASLLRGHPLLIVVCDREAAAGLTPQAGWSSDRVVIVLGHRERGVSPQHRLSAHSRARLLKAQEACLRAPARAVVLTGGTTADGLPEAEQLAHEWAVAGMPALLQVAGGDTADNAARSLPIVLAIGGIRRVSVVTSPWHVRAPLFFAAYRSRGMELDVVRARPLRRWGHLLAGELRGLPGVPRRRREAMAAVRLPPAPGGLP